MYMYCSLITVILSKLIKGDSFLLFQSLWVMYKKLFLGASSQQWETESQPLVGNLS